VLLHYESSSTYGLELGYYTLAAPKDGGNMLEAMETDGLAFKQIDR